MQEDDYKGARTNPERIQSRRQRQEQYKSNSVDSIRGDEPEWLKTIVDEGSKGAVEDSVRLQTPGSFVSERILYIRDPELRSFLGQFYNKAQVITGIKPEFVSTTLELDDNFQSEIKRRNILGFFNLAIKELAFQNTNIEAPNYIKFFPDQGKIKVEFIQCESSKLAQDGSLARLYLKYERNRMRKLRVGSMGAEPDEAKMSERRLRSRTL